MSGSDGLTYVDFSAMQQGKADFVQALNDFNTHLSDLDSAIKTHLAEWEGGARDAYTQAQARWRAAADRMAGLVNGLGGAVGEAHDIHHGTERHILQSWG